MRRKPTQPAGFALAFAFACPWAVAQIALAFALASLQIPQAVQAVQAFQASPSLAEIGAALKTSSSVEAHFL